MKMHEWIEYLRLWWQDYAFMTQETAQGVAVVLYAVLAVLVLGLWLRSFQGAQQPLWIPSSATVFVVVSVLLHVQLQQSHYGAYDPRCHYYERGKLTYELVEGPLLVNATPSDPLGPRVLILLVRAPDWWGDELHVCGLLSHDSVAQELMRGFMEAPDLGSSRGRITFTFGDGRERPNVTFEPDAYPEEKGPPEGPDQDA